jgi:DNA adenine methylase
MSRPKHPALNYYGSKFRLAPWIIKHFPKHETYVEPYAGGASVLLAKGPSYVEVYNDLDNEVVNFFVQLRENPDELIRQILLTPYARWEYEISLLEGLLLGDLERARRFFVRSWLSFSGSRSKIATGWRYQISNARGGKMTEDFARVDHLFDIAMRLKKVQIEQDEALRIISRFDSPETLFYVDPPYPAETRSKKWAKQAYSFEMNTQDHQELLDLLSQVDGMVIISTYANDLYEKELDGWMRSVSKSRNRGQIQKTEILYISPKAAVGQKQRRFF